MSDEDGIPPMQETTNNSEADDQLDGIHIFTELPNYLINSPKKGEVTDFLSNVSEDKRRLGLVMIAMMMQTQQV